MCGTAIQNFLKEYTSTLKGFDRDHLAKVAQKHPEFFAKRTSEENEEMFVEWQLDKSRVRVAGVKKEVDSKMKEIARFVETAVPKYVEVLFAVFFSVLPGFCEIKIGLFC